MSGKFIESSCGNISTADPSSGLDAEEQLSSLLNNVPGAVYRGLRDWSLKFLGAEVERLTGYPPEAFLRREVNWKLIVHPEDLPRVVERFRKAAGAKEKDLRVRYRIRRRDGSERWLEDRRQMIYDEDGRFSYVDGLLLDVTEEKATEDNLRRTVSLLNATLESTADGILVVDAAGKIAISNRRFLEMWRIPDEVVASKEDEQAISFVLEQLKHPEEFLEKVRKLYAASEEESSDMLEFRDGRVFERYSLPMRSPEGVIGRVWSFRDVTERRRAEEAVLLARNDWEDTFDNMGDAVTVHDKEFNIVHANRAARELFGLPLLTGLLSVKCHEHYHGKEDPPEDCPGRTCLSAGRSSTCEMFEPHLNRQLELRAIPRVDRNQRVVGLIHVVRDVTDQRRSEEELRRSHEMLRQSQKMEAVGRLAGGVAHDFNNLLLVIGGYSDLLLQRLPHDSEYRDDVEEIRKAGTRASSLTQQLLAFSRKQVIAPRVADLNEVVAGMEKMLRRLIGEDIDLVTVLRHGLWNVRVDTGQLEQVLMNLAVNARDAMPGVGKLRIETENGRIDEGWVRRQGYGEPGDFVILSVRDTGNGMDEDTLARVFEPFFSTKGQGKGTGLGLATVYGIVKQSGGYITVESRPGEGSTFRIYLPRSEAAVVDRPADVPATHTRGMGETILLVEDEETVRQLLRTTLTEGGYSLLEADDGEEALALLRRDDRPIHLLITDVIMPRMGGKELSDRLAADRPDLKVLFVSGYVDNEILREQRFERGEAYLQKPFTPETLLRTVRKMLEPETAREQ